VRERERDTEREREREKERERESEREREYIIVWVRDRKDAGVALSFGARSKTSFCTNAPPKRSLKHADGQSRIQESSSMQAP
jgi:hypothetical protein